jgi:hypothetical protein
MARLDLLDSREQNEGQAPQVSLGDIPFCRSFYKPVSPSTSKTLRGACRNAAWVEPKVGLLGLKARQDNGPDSLPRTKGAQWETVVGTSSISSTLGNRMTMTKELSEYNVDFDVRVRYSGPLLRIHYLGAAGRWGPSTRQGACCRTVPLSATNAMPASVAHGGRTDI